MEAAQEIQIPAPAAGDHGAPLRHYLFILTEAGWKGRDRMAISYIAKCTGASEDTVLRAMDDMTALGNLERHHIAARGAHGGGTIQDISVLELHADPPDRTFDGPDPQAADERVLTYSSKNLKLLERCRVAMLDHMFARDWGDPSPSMQAFEGCAGWSGAEPHA